MKQYIVDAFTNKPFAENPAAVCVMDSWPSEEAVMKLAMEKAFGVRHIKAALVAISEIVASL